ncbi:S-layer homology domain-containing protein [Cohnella caldifontis]|uniref:S-layer homology domain-containing protein n=1 Tax=Cohnella caldifontis TaxID=3027471 RepID=UPI0023EA852E|nr:S-layer homology domain-containing protein [Cohnella sp. YIM B05605]
MKWIRTKTMVLLLAALSLCFTLAGSAFAFGDVQGDKEKAAIESLEKKGILSGVGNGKFSPRQTMTVANAVALIVKGMDLNIDNIRFIMEPKASDYFTKVKDDAWYAQAFIVASLNGLDIPADINPNGKATREQYAHWLYNAIAKKGDFAWIELYMTIKDEDQINKDYMNGIQKLLIGKIAALDDKGSFRPKQPITRSEAAGMLYRAIEFVKNTPPIPPVDPETSILSDVKLSTEKVNDDVLKVTVTGTVPHLGYGLEVAGISFHGNQAVVDYRLVMPDPAAMYGQMVTQAKATAYVSSAYVPVLGAQQPAESRKRETGDGTKVVPMEDGSSGSVSRGSTVQ